MSPNASFFLPIDRGVPQKGRLGIAWLLAALLLPGLLAGAILVHEIYASERHQLEQGALHTARALSLAVDRDRAISGERLSRLLEEQNLPSGWVATLMDARGTVIARSLNAELHAGRGVSPDLRAAVQDRSEGTLPSRTLEGSPSFVAFSRSPASGWTVAVAAPREALYANLHRPLALAGLTFLAFLLAGAILAAVLTGHLRRALGRLEEATRAGAAGDLEAQAPLAGPREVAQVARQINAMQRARKVAEERLRQEEAQFRQLCETLPQLVWTCTPEGRCDYVGPQWLAYTGEQFATQLGSGWLPSLHPDDRPAAVAAWRAASRGQTPYDVEYRVRRHDGAYRWFRTRAVPLQGDDGQVRRWFGTCTDIEDLKQAQEALRLTGERLETALRNSSVVAFNQDRDLRYTWFYGASLGMDASQVLGRRDGDFALSPEDAAESESLKREVMATGIGQRREMRFRHGGQDHYFDLTVNPLRDADGQIVGITCATVDVTAHKQAEQQHLEKKAYFRATFEQAGVGVCHAALDGNILRVNDKYCAILGYRQEEFLGRSFRDITHPEDLAFHIQGRERLLAGESENFTMEKRYIRKDGAVIWVNLSVVLVRKADGEPDYFLAVIEDIQQRKAAEQALAQEREARQTLLEREVAARTAELEAANRQLESFFYASSHDLRGPLGRISSFTTLLERNYRDRLEGEGLLFLDFIRDNARRLTRLIDDLMSHARIDRQPLRLQATDLRQAVAAVLQEKAPEFQETGAQVRWDLPAALVLADDHGLRQVLRNLLENALKYAGPEAAPAIGIGGREAAGRFRLWVRDKGIGFDMEYHDRIFEIFRRLHTHSDYPGSGIGLALVKRAMERMGGRVWAESEPGQGATFYLEFELAPPPLE